MYPPRSKLAFYAILTLLSCMIALPNVLSQQQLAHCHLGCPNRRLHSGLISKAARTWFWKSTKPHSPKTGSTLSPIKQGALCATPELPALRSPLGMQGSLSHLRPRRTPVPLNRSCAA
jgi:hypothetical protein